MLSWYLCDLNFENIDHFLSFKRVGIGPVAVARVSVSNLWLLRKILLKFILETSLSLARFSRARTRAFRDVERKGEGEKVFKERAKFRGVF